MPKIKYVYLDPKTKYIPHLPIEYIDLDIDIEEHNKQAKHEKIMRKLRRQSAQATERANFSRFRCDYARKRFFQVT